MCNCFKSLIFYLFIFCLREEGDFLKKLIKVITFKSTSLLYPELNFIQFQNGFYQWKQLLFENYDSMFFLYFYFILFFF